MLHGAFDSVLADREAVGELNRTSRCCLGVLLRNSMAAWHPEDM